MNNNIENCLFISVDSNITDQLLITGRAMAQAVSRRPLTAFDPGSVYVGFVVDKVALGQVFPRVLRFSPVNFIPPLLHYMEKRKN
jgi:hypothetical protein